MEARLDVVLELDGVKLVHRPVHLGPRTTRHDGLEDRGELVEHDLGNHRRSESESARE